MSNFSFALPPNIFHVNQVGWPLRGYFIKRGMIPKLRLAETKRPESRFYYSCDDISSLDLWPENLLMRERNLGELRVLLTIPPWSIHLLLQWLWEWENPDYVEFSLDLKEDSDIKFATEKQGSLEFPTHNPQFGISCHFPGRNGR